MTTRVAGATASIDWLKQAINLGRTNPKAIFGGAALLLFALAPLLCLLLAWRHPGTPWLMPVATGCALAGAFVERWLFFAEARHMVSLYY